jgi:hypothetical protein
MKAEESSLEHPSSCLPLPVVLTKDCGEPGNRADGTVNTEGLALTTEACITNYITNETRSVQENTFVRNLHCQLIKQIKKRNNKKNAERVS